MKKIKIGIFGARRGMDYAKSFLYLNCDIVAICENRENIRNAAAEKLGLKDGLYDNFDEFIKHDMDAVFIANNFHEHTPYILECFKRNIHVMCECITNATMAEGVKLMRAYKETKSIFMLAENYPFMPCSREIKRVCDSGTLGQLLYAEGEYNHPVNPYDEDFYTMHVYDPNHWRNYTPASYYITHSLGPIMRATGATPKIVSAQATFAPFPADRPSAKYTADRAAIITTKNDDDSVFRFTGCSAFGAHHNAYRVCGSEGQIENIRGYREKMLLRYNDWSKPEGMEEINVYEASFKDKDIEIIKESGHGGSDFIVARTFINAVRENKQPEFPFNLPVAVTMSSVAILAHRSILEGGKPYAIPDFTKEEDIKLYENDDLTPYPAADGSAPTLPCCSHTDYKPSELQLSLYKKVIDYKE
ncbi:MAG: Gfo/Idh/MocA family oxidoreductase [Ruminococcaceae bacterium]|nr:Gfo/Idh/MocA family oxidoreductase [Oscillospiraceae bacterium]